MTDPTNQSLRGEMLDDVYASSELLGRLPKAGFPDSEKSPRHVFAAVRDELMLDGNSRQNLATFCQTWVDDEIRDLCPGGQGRGDGHRERHGRHGEGTSHPGHQPSMQAFSASE